MSRPLTPDTPDEKKLQKMYLTSYGSNTTEPYEEKIMEEYKDFLVILFRKMIDCVDLNNFFPQLDKLQRQSNSIYRLKDQLVDRDKMKKIEDAIEIIKTRRKQYMEFIMDDNDEINPLDEGIDNPELKEGLENLIGYRDDIITCTLEMMRFIIRQCGERVNLKKMWILASSCFYYAFQLVSAHDYVNDERVLFDRFFQEIGRAGIITSRSEIIRMVTDIQERTDWKGCNSLWIKKNGDEDYVEESTRFLLQKRELSFRPKNRKPLRKPKKSTLKPKKSLRKPRK